MTLAPGARLGAYEVLSPLGAGGMGEVYRARDSKLKREVAVKILPADVAGNPERLARFQREAEVLALLNHPNIAQIFGLEESSGVTALVMELVEGEDLSQRIARGPIPLDEALPIAKQIADALEAAHEQGIIHRDLKPANIKVRADGTVKVLDFGLAKAIDVGSGGASGPGGLSMSPTLTSPAMMTGVGVILGTAAYMSPEQAAGRSVDRRSDLWAFGVVLKDEPDWTALPATTPASIRKLLRRCLQKDRKQRLADAADARLEIADALLQPAGDAAPATPKVNTSRAAWLVTAALGVALIAAAVPALRHIREQPAIAASIEFTFSLPENVVTAGGVPAVSVSPDGQHVVFPAVSKGTTMLWLRTLATGTARVLPGTEDTLATSPIWSPDSRFVAFTSSNKLKKVPIGGGPPVTISTDVPDLGFVAGTWNHDGVILFSSRHLSYSRAIRGLQRVSAAGGKVTMASILDVGRGETGHLYPVFLPDGRHFLYVALHQTGAAELKIGALDSTDAAVVMPVVSQVEFSRNHLLFWRAGSLMAQPFDPIERRLSGEPMPIAQNVGMNATSDYFGSFAASAGGVLAYGQGTQGRISQLSWFDRTGKPLGTASEPDDWRSVAISPDERHAAAARFDASGSMDIWTIDLERSASSRLTFDGIASTYNSPAWAPDGSRVAFHQGNTLNSPPDRDREAVGVYQKAASGNSKAELLLKTPNFEISDWSSDGRYLAGSGGSQYAVGGEIGSAGILVLPLAGDHAPAALTHTRFAQREPAFSPDVHWIAYSSNESGQWQVFVEPFPATGGKFQVSRGGGRWPTWRADGRELFFLAPDGVLTATTVSTQNGFQTGTPQALFATGLVNTSIGQRKFAVSKDGTRFLVNSVRPTLDQRQITVVVNWPAQPR